MSRKMQMLEGGEEDSQSDGSNETQSSCQDDAAEQKKISKNLKVALAAVITIGVGISCHVCQPHADIITSSYVILQIVTTIGYGDITPETPGFKLFMAGYMIVLLVLVAYVMNAFTDWVVGKSMDHMNDRIQKYEAGDEDNTASKYSKFIGATAMFVLAVLAGTLFYRWQEHCSCSYGDTWAGNATCAADPADVDFEVCHASGGQVKTWIDAFYFSVTTVTTVGFGDYTPKTKTGRVFGIVWMVIGVAATANFVTAISSTLFADPDPMDKLTEDDAMKMDGQLFKTIDVDGNGFLSRGEYYEFALKKYGFVTEETMGVLRKKFDEMGGEGDEITFDQLRQARRRKRSRG